MQYPQYNELEEYVSENFEYFHLWPEYSMTNRHGMERVFHTLFWQSRDRHDGAQLAFR